MRRLFLFAGMLTLGILGATAVMADDIFSEPFTSSASSFTMTNTGGDTTTYWYWLNNCPANTAPGHSTTGTMRWGKVGNCCNYVTSSSMDTATRVVDTSVCTAGDIQVKFNYLLNFQETYYDRAWLTINGTNVACWYNYPSSCPYQLNNNNAWNAMTIPVAGSPSSLTLVFNGQTLDSIGNSAQGWHVDDVVVSCTVGGGGACASPQQVAAIEAKMDQAEDVLATIESNTNTIIALTGNLEAKADVAEGKLDGLADALDDQAAFNMDQALLVCGCAPTLYLPEARGGMQAAALAHVRAMHTAVAASADPDEARDLADADCYIKLAETLAGGGRHKVACMALSTAMQLLDGHTNRAGYHPRGVEDLGSEHLCLDKCEVPQ